VVLEAAIVRRAYRGNGCGVNGIVAVGLAKVGGARL
jgi:hypothetical protein